MAKDNRNHYSCCDLNISKQCIDEIANKQVISFTTMLKKQFVSYLRGAFRLNIKDKEKRKIFNYWLFRFFRDQRTALIKIKGIDDLVVANIAMVERTYNNNLYRVSVSYKTGTSSAPLIFSDERNNLLKLEKIVVLENWDGSIWCKISPLLKLLEKQVEALSNYLDEFNLAELYTCTNKEELNSLEKFIKRLYTVRRKDKGRFAVLQLPNGAKRVDLKKETNPNVISELLGTIIETMNLCKQFVPVRHNTNFKKERNISAEYFQEDNAWSNYEQSIIDTIQYALDEVETKFGEKVDLEVKTSILGAMSEKANQPKSVVILND